MYKPIPITVAETKELASIVNGMMLANQDHFKSKSIDYANGFANGLYQALKKSKDMMEVARHNQKEAQRN